MKTCAICKADKEDQCFRQRSGRPIGQLDCYCIPCRADWVRSWQRSDAGRASQKRRGRKYRTTHQDLITQRKKKPGGSDERYRKSEKGRATAARGKAALLARQPNYANDYYTRRVAVDPWFRLQFSLRRRQLHCFAGHRAPGSFVRDIGCTREQFMARMERLFQEGMSWDNYGEWQYDHDVPLAAFDLANREQFVAATHYTNIVPRWKHDNKSKGSQMPWEYERRMASSVK